MFRTEIEALGSVAALPTATSGAAGMTTSLFLRGANSNQTLFLVDGLRLNEPNTDYAVFLEQSWLGTRAITEKTPEGFTVTFDKPAPAKATVDWMLVR